MNKLRITSLLVIISIVIASLAACSPRGEEVSADPNAPVKIVSEYKGGPAELIVLDVNAGMLGNPELFKKLFIDPVQSKYPEINLVMADNSNLDKLLAAGTPPDLVLVSNASLATIIDADLPEDLTPMIKSYNINIAQFEQTVVQQVQKLSNQKMYGLPFVMNYGAMAYNQDIFDKFGVPYPKETMTYEETYDLAKRLTRKEGGVNYIGAMMPDLRQMYWDYGVPVFDKSTGKAKLTTDKHSKIFSLLTEFYSIPGYMENGNNLHSTNLFFIEQRVAMYANWIGAVQTFFTSAGTKDAFKWNLTAHPSFSDKPGLGKGVDFHMAVVNKSSKHKEAAYQVLQMLATKDVQTKASRAGRLSVLKDNDIRNQYGADSDIFKGKSLQSIFKVAPSPLPEASKYDPKINAMLLKEVPKSVMVDGLDINTALRNAEEKANTEIVIP